MNEKPQFTPAHDVTHSYRVRHDGIIILTRSNNPIKRLIELYVTPLKKSQKTDRRDVISSEEVLKESFLERHKEWLFNLGSGAHAALPVEQDQTSNNYRLE